MSDYSRTEELENALEALLECFDRSFNSYADGDGGGRSRPWIEVEVESSSESAGDGCLVVIDGQVNQTTADAIVIAEEVLYHEEEIAGGYEIE